MVVGISVCTGCLLLGVLRQGKHESTKRTIVTGVQPASPGDAHRGDADNPNARSVVEASRNHDHPERLSPLIVPNAFDPDAFAANPKAYLDVVEPGRCFVTASKIGPETPQLKSGRHRLVRAAAGSKVPLIVMGAPNAPVTFTAFGGGAFEENGLNSISVRADARGYAVVHFETPASTRSNYPILVGSPLAVGNVRYLVQPG